MRAVVRLSGGFGNQFFQLAFGNYLAKEFGFQVRFDNSFYTQQQQNKLVTPRHLFANSLFPNARIQDLKLNDREEALANKPQKLIALFRSIRFLKLVRFLIFQRRVVHFNNPNFCFWRIFGNLLVHEFFGVWQEARYVNGDFVDIVRENIFLRARIPDYFEYSEYVGIHIRRGDYLNMDSVHEVLDLDYYRRALELVNQKKPKLKLLVFTDDTSWCKVHLKSFGLLTFASELVNDEFSELALMSNLSYLIIGNSSFSITGGLLSEKVQCVIAPDRWFVPSSYATKPSLPSNWHII